MVTREIVKIDEDKCDGLGACIGYVGKLGDIFQQSAIRSLTIIHVEVPCCMGLCHIARAAMEAVGRNVPVRDVTVSVDGRVLAEMDWQLEERR